ncbi:MAG: hypothetical protein IK104_06435 [Clostridia bacterium]|nr:hypothetical protein [Clostridia bacterium]
MIYVLLVLTALFSFLFMIGMFYSIKYLFFDKVFKQNFFIGVALCFALAVLCAVFSIVLAAAAGRVPVAATAAVISAM